MVRNLTTKLLTAGMVGLPGLALLALVDWLRDRR